MRVLPEVQQLSRRAVIVLSVQGNDLDPDIARIVRQQLGEQEEDRDPGGVVQRARGALFGVDMRAQYDPAFPISPFAREYVAALGRDPFRLDLQRDLPAPLLRQSFPDLVRDIDRRDVKVAVLDEGEGVHTACQLRIPRGGRDDGCGVLGLQEVYDPLVFLRVKEGKILGHQLLFGYLPS